MADDGGGGGGGGSAEEANFGTWVNREKGHFRKLFWEHKHSTVTYCAVFWSFGMCVGFLGPTLWDLGCQTGNSLSTMTWLIFVQSLFTFVGSLTSGLLLRKVSSNIVILVGVVAIALSFLIIPFCKSIVFMAIVVAVMGYHMGLIDTTTNVRMIRLYELDVSPFLQALHFCYGLGAFLSPMIAEPFLEKFDCTLFIDNSTSYSLWSEATLPKIDMSTAPRSLPEAQDRVQIQHAFWIMAFLQVPVAILTFSLVFRERMDDRSSTDAQNSEYKSSFSLPTSWKRCCADASWKQLIVVGFACLLLFFADGMQAAFGDYIFTYGRLVVKGLSQQDAATNNAVFWGTFASGRLLAIFTAVYLAPGFMLFCDILGSLSAMIFLLIAPHNLGVLYLGTATFGLFLSSMYPSILSLTEQFYSGGPMTTGCMVVSAAFGEMIYPAILGNLLGQFGYTSFLAVGNITLWLMVLVFLGLWLVGMYSKNHKPTKALLALWLPRVFQRGPTERTGLLDSLDNSTTYYRRMKNDDSCQSINNFASPPVADAHAVH